MRHCLTSRLAIAAWVGIALSGLTDVRAQVSPEKSAAQLEPARGLEATLWAAEPLLMNPTNIDIDSRGRVWVAEGLNYRLTRGGNKRFKRVEEADRIKILEDTDGDGRADKMTVFADRIFPVPMGIAVEEHHDKSGKYTGCRVFVGNSPNLLVLEDTDGDDKADKRYPLLTGFGGIDSDHGVHGMVLGLDGKLYFTHGDGCCSVQQDHSERAQNFDVVDKSGRHVSSDQLANTLRVNRDGTQFEVICDRQRNNYETSLNSFGNIFTSDNDDDGNRGCRVIWAMDGGHYGYRTPGSARHWGEDVPGNVPKIVGTGNGSPCSITVYEGSLLPGDYRGGIFEVDAGTRQVNFFPLTRHGAAFRTEAKVFLTSRDAWFRPVDACTAPDGSVFVADWYDAGVGGHAFSDQTTGRIFRVAPKGHKCEKPHADFGTQAGLIAALKSPNIATQDAARRGLIAAGDANLVSDMAVSDPDPINRARGLWVWHAIAGDPVAMVFLMSQLNQDAPRLREQAVRILGRDFSENGRVEYKNPAAKKPLIASKNLEILVALAVDPDAGVRRELILALRNLPTHQVGETLRVLAEKWDGRDRWYLEALGLALDHRESDYLAKLFDGSLYGDLSNLDALGRASGLALPPYFPADRNEAFIAVGTPDQPVNALSKYLGLAWRVHQRAVLPLLQRIAPHLRSPDIQQAVDDILEHMQDPETADLMARMASKTPDPVYRRELLSALARRLEGDWNSARSRPAVIDVIDLALKTPEDRQPGIALAAATRDERYRDTLEKLSSDPTAPEDIRVAAVEALGAISGARSTVLDKLIDSIRGKPSSNSVAEAALRAASRRGDSQTKLGDILASAEFPLGLRREALRSLNQQPDGAGRLLALVKEKRLPEDLKSEATTLLNTSPDRHVREQAASLLPLPSMAGGRALPPIHQILRRNGDPEHGREVFFRAGTNSCGSCHRVRGRGQWVGPDLSTIGVKYGRDELLRSISSPSGAIGYSFRSQVVALSDGRVITGLAIEDTPDHLILKTADGQRISIATSSIEVRKTSDVSLMPEGLAQAMSDDDLVNLLAFLGTLRQPVSIVGQYQVIGPVLESNPIKFDSQAGLDDGHGNKLSWRRATANAEGIADLGAILAGNQKAAAYAFTPVVSPVAQRAHLVIDSPAAITVWLNDKKVEISQQPSKTGDPRSVWLELPEGSSTLLIRLEPRSTPAGGASLVTTLVADRPLGFEPVARAAR